MTRSRNPLRSLERWLVGIVMAVIAFLLERLVLRAIRRKGERPAEPVATTFTSRGNEVDG